MKISAKAALAGVLLLAWSGIAQGTTQTIWLHGTIRDQHTSAPVTGAHVRLMPGNRLTDTNAAGEFRFSVSPGQYEIDIHRGGYMPSVVDVTVGTDDVPPLQIALQSLKTRR